MALRLAFAGGGTGGHVVPGLHLLAARPPSLELADLVWFGAGRRAEERAFTGIAEAVAPAEVERVALPLEREGGGAPSRAALVARTPPAALRAREALARHGTRAVLGLGGFTALPVVLAARTLGIPVALLEINAARGSATRWLGPLAARVLHAFPDTLPPEGAGERHALTGPPLGPRFTGREGGAPPAVGGDPEAKRALGYRADRPLLLVLGGSQGARALNRFVTANASALVGGGLQVLHQAGPGRIGEGAGGLGAYRCVEYVDDVAGVARAADLVLCRGGASSLAELAALRRPLVVVPYPHHRDRHQERNALALGEGARIAPEAELGPRLARELVALAGEAGRERRAAMAGALAGRVPLDGADRIWEELLRLARETGARARPRP